MGQGQGQGSGIERGGGGEQIHDLYYSQVKVYVALTQEGRPAPSSLVTACPHQRFHFPLRAGGFNSHPRAKSFCLK